MLAKSRDILFDKNKVKIIFGTRECDKTTIIQQMINDDNIKVVVSTNKKIREYTSYRSAPNLSIISLYDLVSLADHEVHYPDDKQYVFILDNFLDYNVGGNIESSCKSDFLDIEPYLFKHAKSIVFTCTPDISLLFRNYEKNLQFLEDTIAQFDMNVSLFELNGISGIDESAEIYNAVLEQILAKIDLHSKHLSKFEVIMEEF
jgi:hypothetical protein